MTTIGFSVPLGSAEMGEVGSRPNFNDKQRVWGTVGNAFANTL